ncbi:hypothetical protein [Rhizobium ruizarguesonis]|uniref:hypothetical protein n=1 Tax=Rhizobium ruizarguesonis TaxID=2081791 RepID=UPI00102FA202|nr:hypothetical protein [Rhizobium ruizarguesonis]TAY73904.1 hypothetical protein ELH84_08415 [Rhizobium ruizarguesonis]
MKDGESYYITYSCQVTADLNAYVRSQSRLFREISSATEVFAIASSDARVDAAAFETGGAIDPKVVFSVSSSLGSFATNEPRSCKGSLIASGADRPKLAYFLKFNRATLPSGISATLATIQSMISPVYKIVRGRDLADRDAANLEQISAIRTAYNEYLALFTAPESTSRAVPLKVGRNTVTTGAATVTVDVKRVTKGFLLEPGVPFVDSYDKLVSAKPQFTAGNLAISCRILVTSLYTAGFKTADDQAYVIYRSLGPDVIKSKADYLNCLGRTSLAPTVVKNRHLYLKNMSEDLVLNESDLVVAPDPGAADKAILSLLYKFTQAAGSSQNGAFRPGAFDDIAKAGVEVNDYSGDHVTGAVSATPSKDDFVTTAAADVQFGKLVASRYTKYGCFSLTRSEPNLGGDLDGATAVLLAGRPATAKEAAKTVALRLFFEGAKLARVDITDAWLPEARTAYQKAGRVCTI